MGTRRGHGEGTISHRKDGRWTARVDLGWVNGRRKRKQIYGKTRKEVAEQLKILLRDQQQGLPIALERQTVGQFLDQWLNEKVKLQRRPKTFQSYAQVIRLYINPSIGRIQLAKLTPQEVQTLLNRRREEGLSARTVQYVRGILRSALAQAVKWGLVARNVAALVDPPQVERFVTHPLTPSQAQIFLEAAHGNRHEALYAVALWLGLRQGEILGLRWEDIDLDARTLRVEMALNMSLESFSSRRRRRPTANVCFKFPFRLYRS